MKILKNLDRNQTDFNFFTASLHDPFTVYGTLLTQFMR